MIDYSLIEELGFDRIMASDKVYEKQYGRGYYYMSFEARVATFGSSSAITFNWDCDTRDVKVFKNETELVAEFTDAEEFKQFFKMFQK